MTLKTVLGMALGTAVTTAGLLAAPPAQAAGWTCGSWQHKEFATSGFNTDVDIRFCVKRYTTAHAGFAEIKWRDGAGVKKFDNFDVRIRLERYDADYDSASCSYESDINLYENNERECSGLYSSSTRSGGWTVDGYVAYDYDADGEGGKTWSLRGTSQIS